MGPGFFPLDEELALLPGRLTPRLQESLVRLSTWIPSFAKAAAELAYFTNVHVSRETARRLTEAAGATQVARETAAAAYLLTHQPRPPAGPDALTFSVDGAMIPLVPRPMDRGAHAGGGRGASPPTAGAATRLPDGQLVVFLAPHRQRDVHRAGHPGAVSARPGDGRPGRGGGGRGRVVPDASSTSMRRRRCAFWTLPTRPNGLRRLASWTASARPLLSSDDRTRLLHALKHHGPDGVLAELRALRAAHPTGGGAWPRT